MDRRIYNKIINAQSPNEMIKVLKAIDTIYHNDKRLVIEDEYYFFEDRQGNIVKYDSTDEFFKDFRSHKGTIKLYKKLLGDEKTIIKCCIKLAGNLDNAIDIYTNYVVGLTSTDDAEETILEEVIGTQLFPLAYNEYRVVFGMDNLLDKGYYIDSLFSYDEDGKIEGISALETTKDILWKSYLSDEEISSTDDIKVGSELWKTAHKRMINSLLKKL